MNGRRHNDNELDGVLDIHVAHAIREIGRRRSQGVDGERLEHGGQWRSINRRSVRRRGTRLDALLDAVLENGRHESGDGGVFKVPVADVILKCKTSTLTFDDLGHARPGSIRLLCAVAEVTLVQPRPAPHVAGQGRQQHAVEGGGVAHLLPGESVEPTCQRA